MRGYLDSENQNINPTLRQPKRCASAATKRNLKENPATTLKYQAYVEKRRGDMEEKKYGEEIKMQEEIERFIKHNRLAQRVKLSPAIISNVAVLRKKKAESIKRGKDNMHKLEKNWEEQKAAIEFNVANKPLLVEQVSKAFINNLNQIRELQRYVNILKEANLNPDEHLTEEQKGLLLSAEYYDRLNAATAYFPANQV